MNDRYLFKAKRLDNKEWAEGYIYCSTGRTHPYWYIRVLGDLEDGDQEYRIDYQTICAFTTLTDKNGERIWEADFVKTPTGATFVIKWVKKHGEAGLIAPGWLTYGWEPETLEVIRSIHDSLTTPTL